MTIKLFACLIDAYVGEPGSDGIVARNRSMSRTNPFLFGRDPWFAAVACHDSKLLLPIETSRRVDVR
jgi:hypothetical protein